MTDIGIGFEAKIAPELEQFRRPLTDFTPHPDNARKHKIERIARSLETHGQRALVIAQASTGYIVKGNGTFAAMQLLGWQEAAVSVQEMPDDLAGLFLLDDNAASDQSTYDRKKLRAALAKMVEEPGLWDQSIWTIEEFEDLDEELSGATVLEPGETDADFATSTGEHIKEARPQLPGEKMREVPLVLTIADHAMFVERVKLLQQRFGTGGSIATITEAVKRQAEVESAAGPVTGKSLDEAAVHAAKREVIKELRDLISTFPPDRSFTATWLMAQFERVVPYRAPLVEETAVPGQTVAFEAAPDRPDGAEIPVEKDASHEATPVETEGPTGVPPEPSGAYSQADQEAALARYRARP
jgi:hypothetical protein